MSSQSTVIKYSPLQSIDSSTFTGSYMPIGTTTNPSSRIFKIVNDSNVSVTISTDGATDQDFLPADTFVLYDVCTNRGNQSPVFLLPPTQFYVKGAAGTGSVYVVTLHGHTPQQSIPS